MAVADDLEMQPGAWSWSRSGKLAQQLRPRSGRGRDLGARAAPLDAADDETDPCRVGLGSGVEPLGALAAEHLGPRGRQALAQVESILSTDLDQLRGLMGRATGSEVFGDLATAVRGRADHVGLDPTVVEVRTADDVDPTEPATQLAFRVIKEALRSVAKHAHASRAGVVVVRRRATGAGERPRPRPRPRLGSGGDRLGAAAAPGGGDGAWGGEVVVETGAAARR